MKSAAVMLSCLALTACAGERASLLDPSIRYVETTAENIVRQSCLTPLPNCRTSAALLLTDGTHCTVLLPPPSPDDRRIITTKNRDCYRARQRQEASHAR